MLDNVTLTSFSHRYSMMDWQPNLWRKLKLTVVKN